MIKKQTHLLKELHTHWEVNRWTKMPSLPCPDRSPKCYLASRAPDEWNCYFQISAQTWFRSLLLYRWHVMLLNGPSKHDADGGIEKSVDEVVRKNIYKTLISCVTQRAKRGLSSFDDCSMRGKSASICKICDASCSYYIHFKWISMYVKHAVHDEKRWNATRWNSL